MKCKKCNKSFKSIPNIKFLVSLIVLFLIFSGFILFAKAELIFVSGVAILITIVQIEKKFLDFNKVFICKDCRN